MKNKIKYLILLLTIIFATPVYASNTIDYNLTITEDFEFKEVINYRIEDYKAQNNGYNYMTDIINNDIYADVLGKTTYTKQKRLENNIYYVTLTKTFNEYTMSNSAFLNNCFQKPNYKYDMKKYSFSGTGGFNCYDATNMKVTIITDFNVTSTDAIQEGNKYIWTPTGANFSMNINMNKEYKEAETDSTLPYDDIEGDDNTNTNTDNQEKQQQEQSENKKESNKNSSIGIYVFAGIFMILALGVIFIIPILKKKSSSINKI